MIPIEERMFRGGPNPVRIVENVPAANEAMNRAILLGALD
jgi:hypothetical protein